MGKDNQNNPWLGLNSYQEGDKLYGRNDDIEYLVQHILQDNDSGTLLYGKSGIGKTSMLNAGIFPRVRECGYSPISIRLSHNATGSYLSQIRNAIEDGGIQIKEIVGRSNPSQESIYEFFHRHKFFSNDGKRTKLLIVFDQFEEIFTLQTNELARTHFFYELADFINNIMPEEMQKANRETSNNDNASTDSNVSNYYDFFNDDVSCDMADLSKYVFDNTIHLVLTIRADFLSDFEYYSFIIPSLKHDRYGLRPINQKQAKEIIQKPVEGLVDDDVARLIIEKVTEDSGKTENTKEKKDINLCGTDVEVSAAILSLYLSRLYDGKNGDKITAELVEQRGGEIISDFYYDVIKDPRIKESTIDYLEDNLLSGHNRRENRTVDDAKKEGGITDEELRILCEEKKLLRIFPYAKALRIEYIHDILCPVVKEHKETRDAQRAQEEEKKVLIRKQQEEVAKIEKRRKKSTNLFLIFFILFFLATLSGAYLYWWYWMPLSNSYDSFILNEDGWPMGKGHELTAKEKRNRPYYYELERQGFGNKKVKKVRILNRHGKPTKNSSSENRLVGLYEINDSDVLVREFANLQRESASWKFVEGIDGKVSQRVAYDINDKVLYYVMKYQMTTNLQNETDANTDKMISWECYLDNRGAPMAVRKNGVDRYKIEYDSSGKVTKVQFFNSIGVPCKNKDGAYGIRYEGTGTEKTVFYLDEYGDAMSSKTIKTGVTTFGQNYKSIKYTINNEEITDFSEYNDKGTIVRKLTLNSKKDTLEEYKFDNNGALAQCLLDNYKFCVETKQDSTITKSYTLRDSTLYLEQHTQYGTFTKVEYFKFVDKCKSIRHFIFEGKRDRINAYEKNYHTETIETANDNVDSYRKEMHKYYDDKGNLVDIPFNKDDPRKYNCYAEYFNSNNERVRAEWLIGNKSIIKRIYEFKNGILVSQFVAGIDDKPTRFPDIDGTIYYKKIIVRDFLNNIIAIKAVNEFDEPSLITNKFGAIIRTTPDYGHMEIVSKNNQKITLLHGFAEYKECAEVNSHSNLNVQYIHITDINGKWHKAGVQDGDILIENKNGTIKVARPNKKNNRFDIIDFPISKINGDNLGAITNTVWLTKKEMTRYIISINNYNK